MSNSLYSNASNFPSTVQTGVDQRMGVYNCSIDLIELQGSQQNGATLKLTLCYNATNFENSGFGTGWTLQGLSVFDTSVKPNILNVSTGESFTADDQLNLKDQKLKNFRFEYDSDHDVYKIIHLAGNIEVLTGKSNSTNYKVTEQIITANGKSLSLTWDYSNSVPLLQSIQDEKCTLLSISYSDIATTATRFPGSDMESQLTFDFSNEFLSQLTSNIGPLNWTFTYTPDLFGDNQRTLTQVSFPLGLSETVTYQKQGHQMPPGGPSQYVPYVISYTRSPGANQPNVQYTYTYSTNNYLGFGNGQPQWVQGQDNLYFADGTYSYWSTEALLDDKGDAYQKTTRTYNNFHLMVTEETICNKTSKKNQITYFITDNVSFYDQPAYCQMPKTVQVTYTDSDTGQFRNNEITEFQYDDFGNQIYKKDPSGIVTQSEFYSEDGEEGFCPPDPNGFRRSKKSETITPATSSFSTPTRVTTIKYLSLPVQNDYITTMLLPAQTDQYGDQNDQTPFISVSYHYINDDPTGIDYGRLCQTQESVYGQVTTHIFDYQHQDNAITQTITATGFDGIKATVVTVHNIYTGAALESTDSQNVTTKYTYDQIGRKTGITTALNTDYEATHTYAYYAATTSPNPTPAYVLITDTLGVNHRVTVDGLSRVILQEVQDVDNAPTSLAAPSPSYRKINQYTYDAIGRTSNHYSYDWLPDDPSADPDIASTVTYGYDDWGQLYAKTFSDGHTELQTRDPIQLTSTSGIQGEGTTQTSFNLFGQPTVTKRFLADQIPSDKPYSQTSKEYDGFGRVAQYTDALGNIAKYEYDYSDRVITATLPDNTDIKTEYQTGTTSRSLPTSVAVADVTLGVQQFDSLNRPTQQVIGGRTTTFTYNDVGPIPSTVTLPSLDTLSYESIPALSHAISDIKKGDVGNDDTVFHHFAYDPKTGTPTNANVINGMQRSFVYTASGKLSQEIFQNSGNDNPLATNYTYTLSGKIYTYSDVSGNTQSRQYDSIGRLHQIDESDKNGFTITFTYDNSSRVKTIATKHKATNTLQNTNLLYDDFGRETTRTIDQGDGVVIWKIALEYTVSDKISQRTVSGKDGTQQRLEKFEYDVRDRLIDYTCDGSQCPCDQFNQPITHQHFVFDALNNITQVTTDFNSGLPSNVATYTYDTTDQTQLKTITNSGNESYAPSIGFTYDANGRMKTDDVGRTLAYDILGRLEQTNDPTGETLGINYYDAFGNVTSQQSKDSDIKDIFYLENMPVTEMDRSGSCLTRYVALRGITFAQYSNKGGTDFYSIFGSDNQNSVLTAFEASTKTLTQYAYTPYGYRTAYPKDQGYEIGFAGEKLDIATGCYNLGSYRNYNSRIMRFETPDSYSPFCITDFNSYAYCSGDPVNRVDPTGHMSALNAASLGAEIFGFLLNLGLTILSGGAAAFLEAPFWIALGIDLLSLGLNIGSTVEDDQGHQKISDALGWAGFAVGLIGTLAAAAPTVTKYAKNIYAEARKERSVVKGVKSATKILREEAAKNARDSISVVVNRSRDSRKRFSQTMDDFVKFVRRGTRDLSGELSSGAEDFNELYHSSRASFDVANKRRVVADTGVELGEFRPSGYTIAEEPADLSPSPKPTRKLATVSQPGLDPRTFQITAEVHPYSERL